MRATGYPYFEAPFAALAHRGGYSPDAPVELENTMAAFTAAHSLGFRYLETDVRATADGILVAMHDSRLDRVTDVKGAVADLLWEDIARARIGGSESVPRLPDLLDAFPNARFNIDIKHGRAVEPLAALLQGHARERVCVSSFSTAYISQFRRHTRGLVATGASPLEVKAFLVPGLRRYWPLDGQAFQIPNRDPRTGVQLVTPGLIAAAHARGAKVHVWTINNRSEMGRLLDLGVDGIVSDDLLTFKDVLLTRGMWEGTR